MRRSINLKSTFFWKIYLTHTLLLCFIVGTFSFLVLRQIRTIEYDAAKDLLRNTANIIKQNDILNFEKLNVIGKSTKLRVTVINDAGKVLFDTQADSEKMDNHSTRLELIQARVNGSGYSERFSNTLGKNLLYYAIKISPPQNGPRFLRVAIAQSAILDKLGMLEKPFWIAALVGILVSLLVGIWLTGRVSNPINEMLQVCEDLHKGIYSTKIKTLPNDEIGKLGETLNRLAAVITEQISKISYERKQLKTILSAMVEGIVSCDLDGRIIFCNEAAYSLLNSRESDIRGRLLFEEFGFSELSSAFDQARSTSEPVQMEVFPPQSISGQTTEKQLEISGKAFRSEESKGVILVIHDVTKLRKLEQVRRDFIANVSHELKTPLTNIRGYAETLLENDAPLELTNRFMKKIHDNSIRLETLVQDILQLSHIEAEQSSGELNPISWIPIVEQVIHDQEGAIQNKKISISKNLPHSTPLVWGDYDMMTVVFNNLLSNAIRYTPEGGRIIISVHTLNDKVVLNIEDTGIGIKKEYLNRIFERFYRVDKARSRQLGGTGLGLSIVKHLVSNLEGNIEVKSTIGIGTAFSIFLKPAPQTT